MPPYSWLLDDPIEFGVIQGRVDAMLMLGVPYGDIVNTAEQVARDQADLIAKQIVDQGGPTGLGDKQIVALTAYLQRLGTDLMKAPPAAPSVEAGVVAGVVAGEVKP